MRKSIYFFMAFLVILLDQITKYLARSFIYPSATINILPFLQLVNIRNEGAAFGLFRGIGSETFIIIALAAITFVLYLLIKGKEDSFGLSLILGGATGNLIDRIFFGSVTDLIDVFVGRLHWPAFNVADSAITIGVILLLLTQFKPENKENDGKINKSI